MVRAFQTPQVSITHKAKLYLERGSSLMMENLGHYIKALVQIPEKLFP